jgi:hypothetical protein
VPLGTDDETDFGVVSLLDLGCGILDRLALDIDDGSVLLWWNAILVKFKQYSRLNLPIRSHRLGRQRCYREEPGYFSQTLSYGR